MGGQQFEFDEGMMVTSCRLLVNSFQPASCNLILDSCSLILVP